jgi:hypothetical protein
MKTLTSFIPILVAVFSTALACPPYTTSKVTRAASHSVKLVQRTSRENVIVRGASAFEVAQVLGTPDRKLGNDVWIYHNYDAGFDQSPECDCSILVVTLTADRVTDLQLVNRQAVTVFAKQMDSRKSPNQFAGISK